MKHRNTLFLGTSIAAAIAGIGLVTPAIGQITSNQIGTANDGVVCRAGYNGALEGSAFKCSKFSIAGLVLNLKCTNPAFQRYVIRATGSLGTPLGQDICTKENGVQISSTDSISPTREGQDFVYAAIDIAEVDAGVANLRREEARALGLEVGKDLEVTATPSIQNDRDAPSNARGRAVVSVRYYTFAIPTGGVTSASR